MAVGIPTQPTVHNSEASKFSIAPKAPASK
jgi:hypothetical protein